MSDFNQWNVSYSTITFFEKALRGHDMVLSVDRSRDILFTVQRKGGLPPVRALLVFEYVLGLTAVLRAREEFPEADCIVTGANWNSCTRQARDYGRANGFGVFVLGDFLGALNVHEVHSYVKSSKGKPRRRKAEPA